MVVGLVPSLSGLSLKPAPRPVPIGADDDAEGVAKFKWPERLEIIDALPRNPLNKVVRTELRDMLEPA
mgnify:CR=1 FL=1